MALQISSTNVSLSVTAALNVLEGYPAYLWGFSAIDSYLGRPANGGIFVLTGADPADLARLFDGLKFPGIDLADAALDCGDLTVYFRCVDFDEYADGIHPVFPGMVSPGGRISSSAESADKFLFSGSGPFPSEEGRSPSFRILEFYRDCHTGKFLDPRGNYPLLRQIIKGQRPAELTPDTIIPGTERSRALMDWALIGAKYFPLDEMQTAEKDVFRELPEGPGPGVDEQSLLLTGLLCAPNPAAGLDFLMRSGFIREYWPELAVLDDVDQSKEFHPEGNAWKHTLETFRYRKPAALASGGGMYDLRLSLGLLLHDTGKPLAETSGNHRFSGHAELGERQAARFLGRLGLNPSLISDVCYLVRNHMFPAALPRLPLIRTEERMSNPLFPVLMELYRCDESSSFKGLDNYYESSAAYQSFLRFRKNPYRTADGKKIDRNRKSNFKY